MSKELLFSITKKDFVVQTFRSGGPGGQNVNKVATGVRITHPESGAVGQSTTYRTQAQNKKAAFQRLVQSEKFKLWHKMEIARRMGQLADINEKVDKWMHDDNLKIEYGKLD